MNRWLFLLLLSVWSILPAAGAPVSVLPRDVSQALRTAERVILYSLASEPYSKGTGFHGYPIAGSTTITDKKTRDRLAARLEQDVDNDGGALCFLPHHGIRIVVGRTVHDLVICYECHHLHIHTSGVAMRRLNLSGKPDDLDEILLAANVPLTPRRR